MPAAQPDSRLNPHLAAALVAASARVPPERVDEVWVFPPRQVGAKETGLAVLCAYEEGVESRERRTVYTVQYEAEAPRGGKLQRTDAVLEQGTVPVDRMGRIVEGVVRRLGEEHSAPDVRATGGDAQKWAELLAELGGMGA